MIGTVVDPFETGRTLHYARREVFISRLRYNLRQR
jgi:hypothetical protein